MWSEEEYTICCCDDTPAILQNIYYIDTGVLLKNIPLQATCKIHKNYIRDSSGLFSIISHVSLSMISLISSLSLKLYLNSLVYHRNIFGSSSKVFGNLRQSSGIFGNFRKFSENVREGSFGLRNNFGKSLAKTIFYSLAALVRKILFCHSKIKFISSRPRVISSIYCTFYHYSNFSLLFATISYYLWLSALNRILPVLSAVSN